MNEYQYQESPDDSENNEKTIAILSYLTILGWLIAYTMFTNKKNAFNLFHIRQSLGVNILAIAIWMIIKIIVFIPFIGWYFNVILSLFLFIIWILSFVGAINGEKKPVLFIGNYFQKLFEKIN